MFSGASKVVFFMIWIVGEDFPRVTTASLSRFDPYLCHYCLVDLLFQLQIVAQLRAASSSAQLRLKIVVVTS